MNNSQYELLEKIYHTLLIINFTTNLEIENHCVELCQTIKNLASWGKKQAARYDGIADLSSTDFLNQEKKYHDPHKPNKKNVSHNKEDKIKNWENFKLNLLK